MSKMKRITVSLDPEVASWADHAARERGQSFSSVVNATLRSALVTASLDRLPCGSEAEEAEAAYDSLEYVEAAQADHVRRSRGAA